MGLSGCGRHYHQSKDQKKLGDRDLGGTKGCARCDILGLEIEQVPQKGELEGKS